jgi:phosphatidylglycerol---prolipoprotein diacylglyceryl transferase
MELAQPASKLGGIRPVLFHIGNTDVSTYSFFISLGIIAGALIYFYEAKKNKQANEFSFLVAIGAFVGSAIGAKLLELLINIDHIETANDLFLFLFSGRTVIGGLIGGTIGVWLTKRIIGLKAKRGNLFAPAVAIGMAIGRIGCFFNGCCYGKPSHLPWAVDFGDGVTRHPSQLYESVFMLLMFFVLKFGYNKEKIAPGYLFKILMIAYFIYRFLIEFIRVERTAIMGLTYFQIISLFVLIYLVLSEKRLILNQIIGYGRAIIRQSDQQ